MDAAMKMARQYFMEQSSRQPQRCNFIAREGSYHGTTVGSLSMSGHVGRRSLFLDMLLPNIHRVSPCFAYRGLRPGQTTEEYVEQLADELDCKFQQVGPDTVCAFVAEPVVGAVIISYLYIHLETEPTNMAVLGDAGMRSRSTWLLQGHEKSL